MILKLPNFDDRIVKCFTVHDIFFFVYGWGGSNISGPSSAHQQNAIKWRFASDSLMAQN